MPYLVILLVLGSTTLHASWNLLAHHRRGDVMLFARMCRWIALFGVVPVVVGTLMGHPLPASAWGAAAASGMCLAVYFFALSRGYRVGDFTLVYPLARALPILMLAGFDLWRGHDITALGGLGIAVVIAGCLMLTANGRSKSHTHNLAAALAWVAVIALGTIGYSTIDKLAMESIASKHWIVAVQYCCVQFALAWPALHLASKRMTRAADAQHAPAARSIIITIALLNLTSYVLILLAFQLVEQLSYVLALRQFSIVIGVILGAWLLREPSPRTRIAAASCIAAGVVVIALAM